MAWSATELQIMVCCDLATVDDDDRWKATMLLRPCILAYEEKNDTAYITITAPPESYQILRVLNASLEGTIIASETLDPRFPDCFDEGDRIVCVIHAIYQTFKLCVLDPIRGTPNALQFSVKEASDPTELQPQKIDNMLLETPANNQCRKFDNNTVHIWENLRFRSLTETRIAKELDRRKVLFFPNCVARLGFKEREKREPDFLVCHEGKWGILEVDGEDSHPHGRAAKDHERDRFFKQHGILLVEHFDASECWENADGVVKKFLELLRKQR
jgi:hypothetical protein